MHLIRILMKIVQIQLNVSWADPEANIRRIESLLGRVEDADLVILPEMFTTGFVTTPDGLAEESPCRALEWMKEYAARADSAVCGSVALHEDGSYYNRLYFVSPDGNYAYYDKHHLFTYSGEHRTFTAGKERCIVEWCGIRFMLAVCYDLRFPVWLRNCGDYDAIICVASWPKPRRKAWDTLVRARAIENQCYFAAVNRVGLDPYCEYSGGTAFIDPCGETLSFVPDFEEGVSESELDMEALEEFRAKFPVLEDADVFEIRLS